MKRGAIALLGDRVRAEITAQRNKNINQRRSMSLVVVVAVTCLVSLLLIFTSMTMQSNSSRSSQAGRNRLRALPTTARQDGPNSKATHDPQPRQRKDVVDTLDDVSIVPSASSTSSLLLPDSLLRLAVRDDALDKLLGARSRQYNRTFFTYLEVPTAIIEHSFPLRSQGGLTNNLPFSLPKGVCVTCYEMLSVRPRVYLFRNVFTQVEADQLRALGDPLLSRSGVFAKQSIQRSVRSSFGARLPNSDPTAASLNERLMFMINHFSSNKSSREFRAGFAERLEMLRYEGSQTYYGHLDNFGGIDGPIARDRAKKVRAYENTLEKLRRVVAAALPSSAQLLGDVNGATSNTAFVGGATGEGGIAVEHHVVAADDHHHSERDALCASLWKQYVPIKSALLDRGATMIAFLNTINKSVTPGGHTTFPYAAAERRRSSSTSPHKNWTEDLLALPNARQRWRAMYNGFRSSKDSACKSPKRGGGGGTNNISGMTDDSAPNFLSVTPTVGDVVLFYDTYPNGVSDPYALHSGCPPISEEALLESIERDIRNNKSTTTLIEASLSDTSRAGVLDALRLDARMRLSKKHLKVIATKWFMFPVIAGVKKPPVELCRRSQP